MRQWGCTISGSVLLLVGCSQIAGIEAIRCEPACKDETTRIVCDTTGVARTEVCPRSQEECAVPACDSGACTFKPALGARCGETGEGRCNAGFACLGSLNFLNAIHRHTCLATDDGKVWCWGDNTYRQLGDGTDRPGLHPVLVRNLPGPAAKVFVGYGHTCALLRNREVYCWGKNQNGQCGVPASEPISTPMHVDVPGFRFIEVAPGDGHTCARTQDRTVYCWGSTEYRESGADPEPPGPLFVGPTPIPDLDGVEHISAVKNHTCAVRLSSPTLVCWGSNSHVQPPERPFVNGKLGPAAGERFYSATPIPVDIGSPVVSLGMTAEATYAVTQDGRVYAWGENDRFQLGVGSPEKVVRTPTPVVVETPQGVVPLAGVAEIYRSSGSANCVRMTNRLDSGASFFCWGSDDWGELGLGTKEAARATHPYPKPVQAVQGAYSLSPAENHGCAAVVVGGRHDIWCYGRPGALGNGSPVAADDDPPVQWEGTPVAWDPANFGPVER
jgi:alpha-tubulin suppressor-like RCC1 family protein